jgi:hypothetical protein
MDYLTRKLNIVLTDEEYQFITALASYHKVSFYEELSIMFRIGLEDCMTLYDYKKLN